jgi:hypothetical protein
VRWILALGIAIAIATILYAWYRGGDAAALGSLAACA